MPRHKAFGLPRQVAQVVDVEKLEAWFSIGDAQRTKSETSAIYKWDAGIEANMWLANDSGIIQEPGIAHGVSYYQRLARAKDRKRAERHGSWRLGDIDANLGREPLPAAINHRNRRNRGCGEQGSLFNDALQLLVCWSARDAARVYRALTLVFIKRTRWEHARSQIDTVAGGAAELRIWSSSSRK